MEKLVLLALTLLTVYGVKEKPMPDDFNAMDQIYTVNQINPNDDTFSTTIKEEIFEGDIVWTKKLKAEIGEMRFRAASGMVPFDAIRNGVWPNGVVPYTFRRGFTYSAAVVQAIQEYNLKTCIRFKPYTAALAKQAGGYVEFMHGGGCYSRLGRQGGRQDISLGRGCGYKGIAIHEMMHALGFFHEQSRLDRNNYVTIYRDNISPAMYYNFETYRPGQASTLGEPYDKQSIMHYGNYAFSINRRKTIVSKSNPNERLGQRNGLSVIDVRQLKKYYKCGNVEPIKPTPSGCKDQYGFCVDLKSKWCSNSFVKVNCKKSCMLCSKTTCKDRATKRNCNYWRRLKYCTAGRWVQYMRMNCKKTCGHC